MRGTERARRDTGGAPSARGLRPMGRALWLLIAVAGVWVWGLHGVRAEEPARPNVVFLLADDQRWDTIGALGNAEIETPHLDRLVARGFTFRNAYCMGSMIPAVCLPSRAMLLTGRSLWRIPGDPRKTEALPGTVLLPALLRAAGYATFHCGKQGNACRYGNAAFEINRETTGRTATSAREHVDAALEFLAQRDKARPFFLYLAPPVPHDPRLAPAEFRQQYDAGRLTLSKNFLSRHPFDNGELAVRDELLAPLPRTAEVMREHLADYYATITHWDAEVGRLFAALDEQGLTERTVVLYSSDQGLAVGGRHGLMGKQNLYEHVKPPLVLAGPGVPHGSSEALVYLFDLFPTLCELAGVAVPPEVEGRSLWPVVRGEVPRVREYLFAAYRACQRMVRDERWKWIEYRTPGGNFRQLFDLEHDPDELRNLADEAVVAREQARLARQLAAERQSWGDPVAWDAE